MEAYEFHATVNNGYIKIPDEYVQRIPPTVKVIVLAGGSRKIGARSLFPYFSIDTSIFLFNRDEANER